VFPVPRFLRFMFVLLLRILLPVRLLTMTAAEAF
jgi:hypothetical protein